MKLIMVQAYFILLKPLLIGVNLFSLMSSNIKNLSNKIYAFNRDTSFNDNFEFMIFLLFLQVAFHNTFGIYNIKLQ